MNKRLVKDKYGSNHMFSIDDEIIEGLFFVNDQRKVSRNIKTYNIKKQKAKTYNDIGIKYTKILNNVIVTFNIKQYHIDFYGQYLISEYVKESDILMSESDCLTGFKTTLINALRLAKTSNMKELIDFFD